MNTAEDYITRFKAYCLDRDPVKQNYRRHCVMSQYNRCCWEIDDLFGKIRITKVSEDCYMLYCFNSIQYLDRHDGHETFCAVLTKEQYMKLKLLFFFPNYPNVDYLKKIGAKEDSEFLKPESNILQTIYLEYFAWVFAVTPLVLYLLLLISIYNMIVAYTAYFSLAFLFKQYRTMLKGLRLRKLNRDIKNHK